MMNFADKLPFFFKKESVYFFTLHKCASTLFSDFALQRIEGLKHVDHMADIYAGKPGPFQFEKRGHIYGPLRLSRRSVMPDYQHVIDKILTEGFMNNKNAIFFVRDPRDILVSQYHSFGFTHGFSPVPEIRLRQEKNKEKVLSRTLDEYAIWFAPRLKKSFELIYFLRSSCNRNVLLRYEDMVTNWDKFVKGLSKIIKMSPPDLSELHKRSRPRTKVDATAHRRDGTPGQFRTALKPETIKELNRILEEEIGGMGYMN
jgi:hypothetical protein